MAFFLAALTCFGLGGIYGSAHAQAYITGAINWPGGKAQFFLSDGNYVRYDVEADRADPGYPKPVNDQTWPGLGRYGRQIIAATNGREQNKAYFFLRDGTYLRYDIPNDSVDPGYPQPVDDRTWPGLGGYGPYMYGALNWPGGKIQFFFSDGTYIRYDLKSDRADPGYPKPINAKTWPGLAPYANTLSAAINWRDGKAYFFLDDGRYLRYDIAQDSVDQGYPKSTAANWPGLGNYFRRR